jgi:transposase
MDRPFYNVSADASHIEYTDDVRKRIGDKSVERHRHDKYDGMTLRELCEAKDVSYRCIRQRVAKGMSIDEALAVPRDIKRIGSEMRVHEYEGQMYNQAELAKLANVSVATVSRRLKAGLSVAQTVEMTPEQAKKRRADSIWSARRANERNRVQPTTIA